MGTYLVRAIVTTTCIAVPAIVTAQARFRSGVDLVHVGVSVLDKSGQFVTDLKAENFELYEEGQKQEVALFLAGRPESEDAEARHMRLGLLFDTSGSMTDDIQLARSAAVRFLNTFPEAQDITLVDFDTEVRVARYGQADFPRLVERIRRTKPDGWTALYDALGAYLDGSFDMDGRKILVLYTDGGDTRSAVTFSEALDMLRAADVTVYVVGFLEHQSPSVRNAQRMQLMQMADITGGEAFFPSSSQMLEQIFEKVARHIRAQYSLGFTPTNARRDGRWRRLEVRLAGPHPKGLKVRARLGYYAPMQSGAVTASQQQP
jgi:Ca-activated chloride channel family protein